MGKSTAARLLRGLDVPVIDTDDVAREVVRPGEPALDEIRRSFGESILLPDGSLDRAGLAKVVFADPDARRRLEAILHPRIRARWQAQLETWALEGRPCGAVVIPLLFETGAEGAFDAVVCLACSAAAQFERLVARGWSESEIRSRIAAQWPVARKIERATHVVWTEPPLPVQAEQWRVLLRGMIRKAR